MGGNLLQDRRSAPAIRCSATRGHRGSGHAAAGYLENSNVDVVTEFVQMVLAQRAYESNSKVIKAADDMYSQVNNMTRVMLVDASGGGSSVRASKHLPSKAGSAGTRGTGWAAVSTQADLSLPVIRAGDQVVVDQRSTVIQARFQAVALESARMGEKLRVRLSTGGNAQNTSRSAVIAVRAIGAGQAQWQDPNETEP
jgi:hypothetical protein